MLTPHYQDATVTLYAGDCLDVLAQLPDNSMDSVVTDPPYGLEFMGKDWDSFGRDTGNGYREKPRITTRPDAVSAYSSTGGRGVNSFQAGRPFQAWCELWAAECLRVLKPGGHMLAFGGTRTFHRLACAIEDAGFEIRDSIAWLYGSGFPKSLDVSKAIDKVAPRAGMFDTFAAHFTECWEASGLSRRQFVEFFPHYKNAESVMAQLSNWKLAKNVPTRQDFEILRCLVGLSDEWEELIDRVEAERVVTRQAARPLRSGEHISFDQRSSTERERRDIPTTEAAQQWQGWGTALKPAFEPIVVARKPLSGTVAQTVLQWGTGALNIDGTRIGTDIIRSSGEGIKSGSGNYIGGGKDKQPPSEHSGRWPANVVLDESQAEALDQMSGERPGATSNGKKLGNGYGAGYGQMEQEPSYGDSGGASRFFKTAHPDPLDQLDTRFMYTAKAGSDERVTYTKAGGNNGRVTGLGGKVRQCNVCETRAIESGAKEPSCGHGDFRWEEPTSNKVDTVAHPTVKPLDLMRWLVRLVTPPGGVVLEPFAGSGTTVEAAILEGFRCIAIEREPDYLPLITQRIHRRRNPVAYMTAAGEDLGLFADAD